MEAASPQDMQSIAGPSTSRQPEPAKRRVRQKGRAVLKTYFQHTPGPTPLEYPAILAAVNKAEGYDVMDSKGVEAWFYRHRAIKRKEDADTAAAAAKGAGNGPLSTEIISCLETLVKYAPSPSAETIYLWASSLNAEAVLIQKWLDIRERVHTDLRVSDISDVGSEPAAFYPSPPVESPLDAPDDSTAFSHGPSGAYIPVIDPALLSKPYQYATPHDPPVYIHPTDRTNPTGSGQPQFSPFCVHPLGQPSSPSVRSALATFGPSVSKPLLTPIGHPSRHPLLNDLQHDQPLAVNHAPPATVQQQPQPSFLQLLAQDVAHEFNPPNGSPQVTPQAPASPGEFERMFRPYEDKIQAFFRKKEGGDLVRLGFRPSGHPRAP